MENKKHPSLYIKVKEAESKPVSKPSLLGTEREIQHLRLELKSLESLRDGLLEPYFTRVNEMFVRNTVQDDELKQLERKALTRLLAVLEKM